VKIEFVAREARSVLKTCSMMMEPANLYPFYNQMVREALCRDLTMSFSTFPVFTVLLGLVVYPLTAVVTHRFLVHFTYWKRSQVEAFGPSVADESDEDEASSSESESESEGEEPLKPVRVQQRSKRELIQRPTSD